MSKLVLLFICVAILQLADALDCYNCSRLSCETGLTTCQKIQCSKSANVNEEPACLKHVYKDECQKQIVSRKCVFVVKDQPYKCNASLGEEKFCKTCSTDFCNFASTINFNGIVASGILFAFLLPKCLP